MHRYLFAARRSIQVSTSACFLLNKVSHLLPLSPQSLCLVHPWVHIHILRRKPAWQRHHHRAAHNHQQHPGPTRALVDSLMDCTREFAASGRYGRNMEMQDPSQVHKQEERRWEEEATSCVAIDQVCSASISANPPSALHPSNPHQTRFARRCDYSNTVSRWEDGPRRA